MTLIEELNKELTACETELDKCKKVITQLEERRTCYELMKDNICQKKQMIERLLRIAADEQEKANKAKAKQTSTEKPTPSKRGSHTGNNADGNLAVGKDCIPMKELAESLNVMTTVVAKVCNELGYNGEMTENGYMLTSEQAKVVKETILAQK